MAELSGWDTKFEDPVPGLATLRDAAEYIQKLSKVPAAASSRLFAEKSGTLSETFASLAYNRLRRDIIAGRFDPGVKLLVQKLCVRTTSA